MFDTIIIGKGLIGTAAARNLSATGQRVALIGPGEPDNWPTHQGVFASHYDQGRITRILDIDPVWAILAERAIEQYSAIEQESGLNFHYATGGLRVEQPEAITRIENVGQQLKVNFKTFAPNTLEQACPAFRFPEHLAGILEYGQAGYVNPRSMVAAQLKIAARHGLVIIEETVAGVEPGAGQVTVKTTAGHRYLAQKVLIAAGAYTNHLLDQPLDLTPKARTILLAQVSGPELERLKNIPTLIYESGDDPLVDIYMLPPIRYPDGKFYLKIGGDMVSPRLLHSADDFLDWFHSDGSRAEAGGLKETLHAIIPNLKADTYATKPCVITTTPHKHPFIDVIEPGRIFVAAGGCGASAKSSIEIGRIAARLVGNDAWDYDLDQELFKAKYK